MADVNISSHIKWGDAFVTLRRPAAVRALSNKGFESKPAAQPNNKGAYWPPYYLAERQGFEPWEGY